MKLNVLLCALSFAVLSLQSSENYYENIDIKMYPKELREHISRQNENNKYKTKIRDVINKIELEKKQETLLALYKIAIHTKQRNEIIKKIKNFHQEHKISYDEKIDDPHSANSYSPPSGCSPIEWALRWNELDFALFLIKNRKINLKYSSASDDNLIHFLVYGIIDIANKSKKDIPTSKELSINLNEKNYKHNGFNNKHSEILTLLIDGKAGINSMNRSSESPLAKYIFLLKNIVVR